MPARLLLPLVPAMLLAALSLPATAAEPLVSESERSGFLRTGRYDETIALCAAFAQRYPEAVRCQDFGTTPEGRPMKVLVVSRSGALTAGSARERGLPVLLVQGGIHAGEIDGKDAGFLALRQLLDGDAAPGALEHLVLLFVPVFNVDGLERFGPWNRPNQRGPEQTGWRTTAGNLNLNRDYAKAESPEMQAMLALLEAWDPIAMADLHATDGAQFRHDIAVIVEPNHAGDEAMRPVGRAIRDGLIARLREHGSLPLPFYPSFETHDDPASGFAEGVAPPRFSTGYFHLRNRFALLVETHSWRSYPERVLSTRHLIVALVEQAARDGRGWLATARAADGRAAALAGTTVPLSYLASASSRLIDFLGYAYTRTPSEISGALMTRYDETRPEVWRIPLRDDVQPATSVAAPGAGYLVPAAHAAWVAERLRRHGIAFRVIGPALSDHPVEAFRASAVAFDAAPFEGHQRVTLEGDWASETHDVAAGSLFVPIGQARARLVMALLEPEAPDSLAAWGDFNNAFEAKEYMEDYVAEAVAREMLAADPALKAAFERRLADDPAFAASPAARLEFFHRRHPSWDQRRDLYPVLRTDREP